MISQVLYFILLLPNIIVGSSLIVLCIAKILASNINNVDYTYHESIWEGWEIDSWYIKNQY